MSARRWNTLLWAATGAVIVLLLLKFFVADVYRVDSGSMRPTLFGGRERPDGEDDSEHVLVLYGHGAPARFDLVVVRSPDGEKPLVKRVCGLPNDHDFMIRDGDLFVGRARLPADVPRPAPVPVYDDRYQEPERFFHVTEDGSTRRDGAEWVVTGVDHAPGSMLEFLPDLRDDYLDRGHRRVEGVIEVNDARLELEFALDEVRAGEVLRLQLSEEGDLFTLELAPRAGGGASARLLRMNRETLRGKEPELELLRVELATELAGGAWYDLAFENIDNHLRARSRALALDLAQSYDANKPLYEASEPGPASGAPQHFGARVRFGVQSGRARFRGVRVLRDLFYTEDGRFGVRAGRGRDHPDATDASWPAGDSVSLGPDDYFLLGDNSAASTDSRHFGPRQASEILGQPVWVVWPEPRRLRPTEPP